MAVRRGFSTLPCGLFCSPFFYITVTTSHTRFVCSGLLILGTPSHVAEALTLGGCVRMRAHRFPWQPFFYCSTPRLFCGFAVKNIIL